MTGGSLFSTSWQQLSQLKPCIPAHIRVRRHRYRGDTWYVIQDRASGKIHRFTPDAYVLIAMMDGNRILQNLWEEAVRRLGEHAPSQDEVIQLLSQLHSADALHLDVPPNADELLYRQREKKRLVRRQRWRSPLAIRLPLIDPDRVLSVLTPRLEPLLGRFGLAVWCLTTATALILTAMHWQELSDNISDRVLMPSNLVLLGVVYPLVKACHEFGHGIAAKKWGAEVHEMGVMILVFFPVPYVDATDSAAFPSRWQRFAVSSAGIVVEVFLASMALFVWLSVDPGLVSALAYNVMLIGGVSTVLINGNPLLRFDGYYMLSDLLQIPNLGQRATGQVAYLVQKYWLGIESARSPVTAKGERFWLPVYAVTSYIYRLFIITAIALFVAGKYFFVGVILAIWVLVSVFLLPLFKIISFLFSRPRQGESRSRSVSAALVGLFLIAGLLLIPVPSTTRGEGVVWLPEEAFIRVTTPGIVDAVLVESGEKVQIGQALFQLHDELLDLDLTLLESRIKELQIMQQRSRVRDLVEADIIGQQLDALREEFTLTTERHAELDMRALSAGTFVTPSPQDMVGRYLRRGEVIGYVLPETVPGIRAVVPQHRAALVRERTKSVSVMLINAAGEEFTARIVREIPEATTELPSLALSIAGGGEVAVNPQSGENPRSFFSYFVFDLGIEGEMPAQWYGQRVYVRFEHGLEPLLLQFYRTLRQTFLDRFDV